MEHPFQRHHQQTRVNNNPNTNTNHHNSNDSDRGSIMSSDPSYSASVRGGPASSSRSTYRERQPIHNFLKSINPYHYHRSRRHRSQKEQQPQQQQQQLLPLQQQQQAAVLVPPHRPPPPPPGDSSDATNRLGTSTTESKSGRGYLKQFIMAVILVASLGSLCISLFLLYQYLMGEPKCVQTGPSPRFQRLVGGPSTTSNGQLAWIHVSKLTKTNTNDFLHFDKDEGVNITRTGMRLTVLNKGMYYIYFAIAGRQKDRKVEVEVKRRDIDKLNKVPDDTILKASHMQCKDTTGDDMITMSNGGLFKVLPKHYILMSATFDEIEDSVSYLGAFMVVPDI